MGPWCASSSTSIGRLSGCQSEGNRAFRGDPTCAYGQVGAALPCLPLSSTLHPVSSLPKTQPAAEAWGLRLRLCLRAAWQCKGLPVGQAACLVCVVPTVGTQWMLDMGGSQAVLGVGRAVVALPNPFRVINFSREHMGFSTPKSMPYRPDRPLRLVPRCPAPQCSDPDLLLIQRKSNAKPCALWPH